MIQVVGQIWGEVRNAVRAAMSLLDLLALGAAAGFFSFWYGTLALVFSGLRLTPSFLLLKDAHEDILGTHRWIAHAWVGMCHASDHRFTFHSTLENSVSSATRENFFQVATYRLVAALVPHSRRLLVAQDPRHLRTGPVLAWVRRA